jgi:thiamine phosphate synthase YjbQ (UPF0047 family)
MIFPARDPMIAHTYTEALSTQGRDECVDITPMVRDALRRAKIRHGLATIFVTGSTAGVTTIEYEPGLVHDLKEAVRLVDGKLQLGTWQQSVLIDFDTHPRTRSSLIQFLGE